MLQCWELETVLRPSFSDLVQSISTFLEGFMGYMDISAFETKPVSDSNADFNGTNLVMESVSRKSSETQLDEYVDNSTTETSV